MKLEFLSKLLFPRLCIVCRKDSEESRALCDNCLTKIDRIDTLFCGKCRARLPEGKKICHKEFPYILGAATTYSNETARELIHSLKFKFLKEAAEPISVAMADYFEKTVGSKKDFLVIPIPLGKQRLRQRGFNQAEVVAQSLSKKLGLDFEGKALNRTKETQPQSEQKHFESRIENVRGCFSVIKPELVSHKNVLLIDDVTTSGATFLEASRALKQAGAKKIIALAMAIA